VIMMTSSTIAGSFPRLLSGICHAPSTFLICPET
jgi:hypothetical protein